MVPWNLIEKDLLLEVRPSVRAVGQVCILDVYRINNNNNNIETLSGIWIKSISVTDPDSIKSVFRQTGLFC